MVEEKDGYIKIVGRNSDIINVGGEKVKRVIKAFNSVVTVYDIPSEKRSAV